jgi:hypothetical protein
MIQECAADGSQGCVYGPNGPRGERQCEYCGAPEVDGGEAVKAAYARYKYAQGTRECIAFFRGAVWQSEFRNNPILVWRDVPGNVPLDTRSIK